MGVYIAFEACTINSGVCLATTFAGRFDFFNEVYLAGTFLLWTRNVFSFYKYCSESVSLYIHIYIASREIFSLANLVIESNAVKKTQKSTGKIVILLLVQQYSWFCSRILFMLLR